MIKQTYDDQTKMVSALQEAEKFFHKFPGSGAIFLKIAISQNDQDFQDLCSDLKVTFSKQEDLADRVIQVLTTIRAICQKDGSYISMVGMYLTKLIELQACSDALLGEHTFQIR